MQDNRTYLELIQSGDYKVIYERMVEFESDSFSFENFPNEWKPEIEYWINEYKTLTSHRYAVKVFSKDLKTLYLVEHSNKYVLILEGVHEFYVSYKVVFKIDNKNKGEAK